MSVPGFVIVSDDEETGDVHTAVIDETGNQKLVSLEEAGNYRQITSVTAINSIPATPRHMMSEQKATKSSYQTMYKCDTCDVLFEGVKLLRQHRKEEHGGLREQQEKKIVYNRIRSAMEKRNEEMEAMVVKDAFKASQLSSELQALETKTAPKRPRYIARKKHRCAACNKSFATPSMLIRHQSVHTGKKPHWCRFCGKNYTQQEHLLRHIRAVHEDQVQGPLSVRHKPIWHTCSVCGQKFTAKYRYVEHLKVHINGLFECHLCDRKFTMKNSLIRHIRSHSGERNFECDVCGKKFGDQQTMKNHKRLHTGDYRYRCNVCDKGFSKKNRLEEHLQKHQEDDIGLTKFCCSVCYERFGSAEALEAHRKLHTVALVEEWKGAKQRTMSSQTPLAEDENGKLLFHCSTCLQSFHSQADVTRHCQLYHKCIISDSRGFSRFSCDVCKKFFVTREEIQLHMRLHDVEGGRVQTETVSGTSSESDSSLLGQVTTEPADVTQTGGPATAATTTTTTSATTITVPLGSTNQVINQQYQVTHVGHIPPNQCQIIPEYVASALPNFEQTTVHQLTITHPTQGNPPQTSSRQTGLHVPPKKKPVPVEPAPGVLYNRSLLTGLLEPVKETVTQVTTEVPTMYAIEESGQLYGVSDNGTMYQVVQAESVDATSAAGWPPTEQQMESGDLLLDIVPQDGSTLSFLNIPQVVDAAEGQHVQYVIAESQEISPATTEDVTCKLIQAAQRVEELEQSKPRGK